MRPKRLRKITESNKTAEYYTKDKAQRLKEKPINPNDVVKLGGKTPVELNPVITGKAPFSQSTLHPKSMVHDKAATQEEIDRLIELYSGHNAAKRKDFIEWLQSGAGVPENYVKKNRKGMHKEHADINDNCKQEIRELMDDDEMFIDGGLSEEFKTKATDLYMRSLQERMNEDQSFKRGVQQLLETTTLHPFNPPDTIGVMEKLATRISELEDLLTEAALEKRELRQSLQEERFYQNFTGVKSETRQPKKSVVEETMEYVSEDAINNYYNQQKNHSAVSRYIRDDGRLYGMPRGDL